MSKRPPLSVWVYWCANCGNPFTAAVALAAETTCPVCPAGHGRVQCARYELADRVRRSA